MCIRDRYQRRVHGDFINNKMSKSGFNAYFEKQKEEEWKMNYMNYKKLTQALAKSYSELMENIQKHIPDKKKSLAKYVGEELAPIQNYVRDIISTLQEETRKYIEFFCKRVEEIARSFRDETYTREEREDLFIKTNKFFWINTLAVQKLLDKVQASLGEIDISVMPKFRESLMDVIPMITKKFEDMHEHAKITLEDKENPAEANIGALHSFFCARNMAEAIYDINSKALSLKKSQLEQTLSKEVVVNVQVPVAESKLVKKEVNWTSLYLVLLQYCLLYTSPSPRDS
eukprot:TRINITY_DN98_c0_g1_i12.p1 TRINITY_DN98_c0_g1~~TRINITY_DN98_c0_g1_i12.p1  ORF type:complete len:286 (-),score=84.07 TRINITY_DN98_c0_g1_i12:63-920(-)